MADVLELPLPTLNALPFSGAHFLTDAALYDATGVRIAFAGRHGGVSKAPYDSLNCGSHVGDNLADVLQNRELLLEALGAKDAALVVPNQVHGTDIIYAVDNCAAESQDAEDAACRKGSQDAEDADAVIVTVPEVAALLNFADCLPLIVVAPSGAFAVIHAGWRGAFARIASKTVAALADETGENPATFNGYIGPHIGSCCFEVSEEVAGQFEEEFGPEVVSAPNHVSIAAAVKADLQQAGLLPKRIVGGDICTVCRSADYFSFRATDGTCGRQAAISFRKGE